MPCACADKRRKPLDAWTTHPTKVTRQLPVRAPHGVTVRESEEVPEVPRVGLDSPPLRVRRVPRSVNGVRLSVETVRALTRQGPRV